MWSRGIIKKIGYTFKVSEVYKIAKLLKKIDDDLIKKIKTCKKICFKIF